MLDPKIVISGAAAGEAAEEGAHLAFQVGKEVANHGGVLVTGATTGIPLYAAKGAKSVHGQVIGFSPASTPKAHIKSYRLPTQYHDVIFFTGQEYAGRDIMLVDVADAVLHVSGRVGTIHEFSHAFERRKIIGILTNSGGTIDMIPEILERAGRGNGNVIVNDNPRILVRDVMRAVRDLFTL